MADYFSQGVLTEGVYLTPAMVDVIERICDGETYATGNDQTVLDGMVNGQMPLNEYHVTFESGWDDACAHYEWEELLDWKGIDDHDLEDLDDVDEFKRLALLDQAKFMREILKVNPEKASLHYEAAHTCSRMRLDGFGGSSVTVTRKGYMYKSTNYPTIDEDGTISDVPNFTPWDEDNEQAEAA
jgi:hypothetical protein